MTQARTTFLALTAVFAASVLLPLPGGDGRIAHLPSLCPFHEVTGMPCPGCGLTRAFVCLGHGQFAASLHWHPIGWLVYAAFLLLWARAGLTAALGRPFLPLSPLTAGRWGWASVTVLVSVGLTRLGWAWVHPSLRLP